VSTSLTKKYFYGTVSEAKGEYMKTFMFLLCISSITATVLGQFSPQWGTTSTLHGKVNYGKYAYIERDELGNFVIGSSIEYIPKNNTITRNEKVFKKTFFPVVAEKEFIANIMQGKTWTYTQKNTFDTIYDFNTTGQCVSITHDLRLHEKENAQKAIERIIKTLNGLYGNGDIDWRWNFEQFKKDFSNEYDGLVKGKNKLVVTWKNARLDAVLEYSGLVVTIRYEKPDTATTFDDIFEITARVEKEYPPVMMSYEELSDKEQMMFQNITIKE